MAAVGFASLPVAPGLRGFATALNKGVMGPLRKTSKQAGDVLSAGMTTGVAEASEVLEKARYREKKATEELAEAQSKLSEQQDKNSAANRDLATAQERLNELMESGEATATQLANAQSQVDRRNAAAEASSRALTKAQNALKDANEESATAKKKAADRADELAEAQERAESSSGRLGGVLGDLRDRAAGIDGPVGDIVGGFSDLKGLGPVALVGGIASAAAGAATAFGKFSEDLAQSRVEIQNSMGLTADAARDMQGEVADALSHGFGMEATEEAVLEISRTLGDNVAHMGGLTASQLADDFLAFNQTFDRSAQETASSVDVLLNSGMVSSAQEGLDLLTAGMQQVPSAMQDEVFDALNEYSKNFANLGISGAEAMSMLVDASENGQYSIDKTGDAIKEFSVLAIDPAKAEAFESIGLNAEDMATAVAGGGDSASAALRDAAQGLLDMEDPGKRAATAVELFGAPVEDLGVDQIPAFLESLTAGSDGMGDFAGSAQEMADNTQSTLSGMWASLKGQFQGWAIDATLAVNEWGGEVLSGFGGVLSGVGDVVGGAFSSVREVAVGAAQPLVDEFTTAKDTVFAAWDEITVAFQGGDWGYGALSDLVGAENAEWVVDKVSSVLPAWDEVKSAFQGGDWGYGALSELVGADRAEWVVDKIGSIAPAWGELTGVIAGGESDGDALSNLIGADNADWLLGKITEIRDGFLDFRDRIVEGFGQVREALSPLFDWLQDFVGGQLSGTLESLQGTFSSLWESVRAVGEALGGALGSALGGAIEAGKSLWDALSPVVELLGNVLMPVLKIVGGVIGGVVVGAVMLFVGALRLVAGVVEAAANVIQWLSTNVLAPLIGIVGQVAAFLTENLAGAFSWVITKVAEFGNFLLENFWPAVQTVTGWVGSAFSAIWDGLQWAWSSVIQPVFNGIWTLAQGTLAVLGTVVLAPLLVAWNLLSAGIEWAWANVIEPVWSALSSFAQDVLWPALQDVFAWIQDAWSALGDAFSWVNENLIQPVWSAVQTGADMLWQGLQTIFGWVEAGWSALGDAFRWIYDSIVKPVFDGFLWLVQTWWDGINVIFGWVQAGWSALGDGLRWVYDSIIKPMFDAFSAALNWLYENAVVPVLSWIQDRWDDMGAALQAGKDFVVNNVFEPLKNGLTSVKDWFGSMVENIGNLWDGIKRKAAEPVNFVIDAVFNNGILAAWNKVAGLVGLQKDEVRIPTIGGYALGGVLPGYTPGRDVHDFYSATGGHIGLSGGESILRPEATRVLGPSWVDGVNLAARQGGEDGVKRRLTQSHFANGGIVELGNYASGVSNLAGALSGIQASHARFVGRFFPDMFHLTSASRNEPGSMHDYSRQAATDWQALDGQYATQMPTPNSKKLARAINTNFPTTQQLIHWPLDGWNNLLGGRPHDYGAGTNAQHANHVHWGTNSPLQFDGDDIVLTDAPGGGVWESITSIAKRLWDGVINAIGDFPGADAFGKFGQLPGAFLKTAADTVWNFIKEKADALLSFVGGGGGGAQQWAGLAEQALAHMGYGPEHLDAMLQQIQIESGGDPGAVNNWDSNADRGTPSGGLLQVIEPTYRDVRRLYPEAFEGLPDDRFHPLTNLTAGVAAVTRDWGGPAGRWPTRDGYADGTSNLDLRDLFMGVFDTGGVLPAGGIAVNRSRMNEVIVNGPDLGAINALATNVGLLVRQLAATGDVDAFAVAMREEFEPHIAEAQRQLELLADPESVEGITARSLGRGVAGLGVIPYADTLTAVLDAEQSLMDSRAAHAGRLEAIVASEKALADANAELDALLNSEDGLSVQNQRKLDDAQKALDKANAAAASAGEGVEDAEKRADAQAKAAEKVTDAEEKLRRVREDLAADAEENAVKREEDIVSATENVTAAENELAAARRDSVAALDHLVLPETVGGFIPQLGQAASALEGLIPQISALGGIGSTAGSAVAQLAGSLAGVAATATPAGLTVGLVLEGLKVGIDLLNTIVDTVGEIIDRISGAIVAGWQAVGDMFGAVAEWQGLVAEQQQAVSALQQQVVRDTLALEEAQWGLRTATFDRMTAEAEGITSVTKAAEALWDYEESARKSAALGAKSLTGDVDRLRWASEDAFSAAAGAVEETAEWRALAYDYFAASAEFDRNRLAAEESMILAFQDVVVTTVALQRTQEDLIRASAALNRMTAETFGYTQKEATVGQELTRVYSEIAELEASIAKPGGFNITSQILGGLLDWDGDGKTFGIDNPLSQRNLANERRLQQLEDYADRLLSLEDAPAVNSGELDSWRNAISWNAGLGLDTSTLINSSPFGQAQDALAFESLMSRLDGIDQNEIDIRRSIEDLEREVSFAEQLRPIREEMAGLDALVSAFNTRAEAEREENGAIRDALLAEAEVSEAVAAALGKTPIQVSNVHGIELPAGMRDPRPVRVTHVLPEGKQFYSVDEVKELLVESGRAHGSPGDVVQGPSASDVVTSRRNI